MSALLGELVPVGGGDAIPLTRPTLVIGRRDSCDVCLRFPNVSGQHCELSYKGGYWYVRDMGSTNGVKVNNVKVQSKGVRPGDQVAVANHKFTLNYTLPADAGAFDDVVAEDLTKGLLEKAGLVAPPRPGSVRRPPPRSPTRPDGTMTDSGDRDIWLDK